MVFLCAERPALLTVSTVQGGAGLYYGGRCTPYVIRDLQAWGHLPPAPSGTSSAGFFKTS